MRKLMWQALVVLLSLGLLAVPVSAGEATVSPFVGHWEGINEIPGDPGLGDNSRMIINISEGPDGVVNIFFKDFGASACGTDPVTGEWLYGGQAKWLGFVDDSVLWTYGRGGKGVGNGALWCMANPPFVLFGPVEEPMLFVTYDPETDTLFDGFDFFYRVRNN